jgi:acetoin utilization deacetylase AcuC-like enzyme
MKIITDEKCAGYACVGHPERPQRITATVECLQKQTELPLTWFAPTSVSDGQILRAHTPEVLARLKIPQDFDADTPFFENIPTYARASVAAALDAMKLACAGENVFSLMRPPGHHATREHSMGFCYLNNIAIAALEAVAISSPSPPPPEERAGVRRQIISSSNPLTPALSQFGRGEGVGFKRVAVFDFDVHHGNGTEDILLNREGTAFFSIHQFPAYPGTGEKNIGNNCFNYPVAPSAPREIYRATLARALADLKKFAPDLIAVSAGFDAYVRDPLAQGALLAEDFHWLGRELRALKTPFFSLLEGGYSRDLPDLIFAYLKGVAGK